MAQWSPHSNQLLGANLCSDSFVFELMRFLPTVKKTLGKLPGDQHVCVIMNINVSVPVHPKPRVFPIGISRYGK